MSQKDKFSRVEAWKWYSSYMPSKSKLPRKKRERENDKRQIRYAAIVLADRLVIGMWRGCEAEPVGLYYMTSAGSTNVCKNGKDWSQGKLLYLPCGGWNYWCSYYNNRYTSIDDTSTAMSWLEKHFSDNILRNEIHDIVDRIESNISFQKRQNSRERKIQRFSEYANSMPPLPADFDDWLKDTVYAGLHFAFGSKGSDIYKCTACGGEHTAPDWKHRKWYECPKTKKRVKVTKVERGYVSRERALLIQSHHDMQGNICSVARYFTTEMRWNTSGECVRAWPDTLLTLSLHGELVRGDDILYYQYDGKWSERNTSGYSHAKCYCYPDVSALDGTRYAKIGLAMKAAAAKGWKLHYNNLMRGCHDDPRIEYIVKGGFYRLTDHIASGVSAYILNEGSSLQEALGLDGQGVARLKQADGNEYYLKWLRCCFENGYKLPEEAVLFFSDNKVSPNDVGFALSCGMSPEQIANYLKKDHGYVKKDFTYYYENATQALAHQWRDYIDMAKKLKLDIHNPSVHKPKDLKYRHDELVEICNQQRNELERERIENEYPKIKPVCERIKSLYEWSDGTYAVIVPKGAADIMREGRLLGHCVGSSDRYFDRIAEEESYIMFLRKSEDADKPWYTMEVEPGGCVRQLRTIGDAEGADRAEAKAFLSKWRKEIARRVGPAERAAAEVSREKRLLEFEELRRGGNIIRNGRLAGKLLVEVLEADFKEYNQEEYLQGAS